MGPKNMNDQLALHNIPRYTYHHFSKNVQTMFLLMLRIIYIYILYMYYIYTMHVQTLSVFSCPYANGGRWLDMSMGCQWDIAPMLPCHIIGIQ